MTKKQGGTGFPSRQIASQPDETKRTIPRVSSMCVASPRCRAWSRLSVMREGSSSCLRVFWYHAAAGRSGAAQATAPSQGVAVQAHVHDEHWMPWLASKPRWRCFTDLFILDRADDQERHGGIRPQIARSEPPKHFSASSRAGPYYVFHAPPSDVWVSLDEASDFVSAESYRLYVLYK